MARAAGFTQVSASYVVSPLMRLVPRGDTTVVDAYLSPILRRYVDHVAAELAGVRPFFMQSNGGLAEAHSFQGKDAILSGPAGGIVGAARTATMAGLDRIIGFDMGVEMPPPMWRCMPARSSGRSRRPLPVCGCARR